MSKKITYQELKEAVQESPYLFREMWVDHNPFGEGERTKLRFFIDGLGSISSFINNQTNIKGVNYGYYIQWKHDYTGTFELVVEPPVKPEVYVVGDLVVVLAEIKKCRDYENWNKYCRNSIGKTYKIEEVSDSNFGINYYLESGNGSGDGQRYPHYAVHRVSSPKPETITINNKTYLKSEYDSAIAGLEEIKL